MSHHAAHPFLQSLRTAHSGKVVTARDAVRLISDGDAFGESGADEAAGRDSVPVADQAHRIAGGHDFAAVSRS